MAEPPPILETIDLARSFDVSRPWLQRVLAGEGRRSLQAVDGVSFAIPQGHDPVAGGRERLRQIDRRAAGGRALSRRAAARSLFEGDALAQRPRHRRRCAGGCR